MSNNKTSKNYLQNIQYRAAMYDELIMAVENKYLSETRHETALRYIKDANKQTCAVEKAVEKMSGVLPNEQ